MNNTINVEAFKNEWAKIEAKLNEIADIPKLEGNGKYFNGYDIEDSGITYKSATDYDGCGTDTFSFEVKWEEINNPIEYFENKYSEEIKKDKERKDGIAARRKKFEEDDERELALKLKAKYNL